ncbi:GntR family transcriptional regulator [Bacilliculturomica massiliensis]|uniref:GntR family transcriptional regulator n=1 Tax=Bacilliculturomica massiliensis TaxID=1917867 RepID=UPI0013EF5BC7|nr:GntR family transcriptional regulator [Bacilliculturomica massiliensis]
MINKKNLSEQIYEAIKSDILTQKIGFGEKLTNRGLQTKFGVSSTPVRDAINRLYLDGILEDISNGGARVIPFDIKMALEVNEIIALLSRDALGLTVSRHNQDKVIRRLEHVIGKQKEYLETPRYLTYDKQFHRTFFEYCGNSRLIRAYDEHSVLWDMHIQIYHQNSESTRAHALAQHQQILDTYRSGDCLEAQRLLASHFLDAVGSLERQLTEQGSKQK